MNLQAQTSILDRQKENVKNKVNNRIENRIDRGVDKTLDKVEEKIDGSGKKKENETNEEKSLENSNSSESQTNEQGTNKNNKPIDEPQKTIKSYSKFDYLAGEKILVYDQFETTEIGDFPVNWNTSASAEIVKIDGKQEKFIKLAKTGIYQNEDIKALPENFTLDFDFYATEDFSEMMSGLKVVFVKKMDSPMMYDQHFGNDPQFGFDIHPGAENGSCSFWVFDPTNNQMINNTVKINLAAGKFAKISIWRQKNRVRVYVDEQKVIDLPKAFFPEISYESIFATNVWEGEIGISNIRYAVGAPDTRSKLITEGKLVSRGILFDSNAATIKAESYGSLKEIASVLLENPTVRVKIIGHTDSDGDEKANLELSKKRAEAVKQNLIQEFKIPANQLETDGKGETEPSDSNSTPAGKANNRRVEFIKL